MSGVVVGVDGSPHSLIALDWALTESVLRKSPLTVLAVHPVATDLFGLGIGSYPPDEQGRARAEQAVSELVAKAVAQRGEQAAPAVTVRAVSGLPAGELIRASEGADLLVVGARGVGGFSRLVLGSVSTQVSHHAACPVVIVPRDRTGH